jgi:hypothetical protein
MSKHRQSNTIEIDKRDIQAKHIQPRREDPTVTMIPEASEREEMKAQAEEKQPKLPKRESSHRKEMGNIVKKKKQNHQEESLNLFNQIETEKNQRLNIDDEVVEHLAKINIIDNGVVIQQEIPQQKTEFNADDQLNRSTDKVHQSMYSHTIQPNYDAYNQQNKNNSFEKMDNDPIEKGPEIAKLEHSGSQYPRVLSKFGGHYGSTELPKLDNQEEIKSTQGNVFVRLKGVSEDYMNLQLSISFKEGNNEVKFMYNLANDTPEGILNEMRQANFDITPVDFENIRLQITKCVSEAIEKIRKIDPYKNGMSSLSKENSVLKPLSEGSHSST